MLRRASVLPAVLIVAASMLSCGGEKKPKQDAAQQGTPQTETHQPVGDGVNFTAQDLQGISRNSAQWIGKQPVVLNFWGTWCPPCRREIPDLVKLYDEYHSRGIEIIGLAVKDEPGDVSSYAMRAGMKWVLLMANDDVLQAYNVVNGVPTTVFLDADGREITRFIGNQTYADFKPAFEAILQGHRP